jgi:AcrR family transcriptional regulator
MRADAQRNYSHLLATAREAFSEQGSEASLRDIARRADVGLATLCRHFPTREALLDALLRDNLDRVRQLAETLETSVAPDEALLTWTQEAVGFTHEFRGVVDLMAAAMADEDSALHVSCTAVRSAGARLLARAQAAGVARTDMDGVDLLTLIAALGWINDQPSFAPRADHLFDIIAGAILIDRTK